MLTNTRIANKYHGPRGHADITDNSPRVALKMPARSSNLFEVATRIRAEVEAQEVSEKFGFSPKSSAKRSAYERYCCIV